MVVDRAEDFVTRVGELGLEGVVAKRLDSTYMPGRRIRGWVKHKLRREEQLAVTGLRRSRDGRPDAVFVARRLPDGSFTGAGSIELGLRADVVHELERRLGALPARRRGAIAWYPGEVSVIASVHGFPDGRDAVLRDVIDG